MSRAKYHKKVIVLRNYLYHLNHFDELLLDVPLDDERARVRRVGQDQRRVDRHLPVHREEPVDLVEQVDRVQ